MPEDVFNTQFKKDNYRLEDVANNDRCCIFCSSHALYNHSEESFYQQVVLKDKYEFDNIAKDQRIRQYFGRIIYIRDIFMHFYVNGINSAVDSIDKLAELLKSLTNGYKVTIVGCSAGGYIAMILGAVLKAERVFSFAGQFVLTEWRGGNNKLNFSDFPSLVEVSDNIYYSKYFDIRHLIADNGYKIYHFYGCKNEADCNQVELIKGIKNVLLFAFNTVSHGGVYIYSFDIPFLLTSKNDNIDFLQKKFIGHSINKLSFSNKLIGFRLTVKLLLKRIFRKNKKKS